MQASNGICDDMLAAFADGLLDEATCETVITTIDNDPDTRERYHRLRHAKDLMKLGFGKARATSGTRGKHGRSFWHGNFPKAAAAIAVIAVSIGAGDLLHHYRDTSLPVVASIEAPKKIILHIDESDPAKFQRLLDYTESFLLEHKDSGSYIDVIANAGGIDLLRKDKSHLANKVASIMQEYDNVQFIACANAIRTLRSKGIEPEFADNIHTRKTAVDYIASRLQEGGWTYIKADSLPEA